MLCGEMEVFGIDMSKNVQYCWHVEGARGVGVAAVKAREEKIGGDEENRVYGSERSNVSLVHHSPYSLRISAFLVFSTNTMEQFHEYNW